ncbi:unnamed protein product [Diabrotica balteata]|uniref:Uncharacterized protein n=1 Tax=Diabrotica balteata TaxID=107213 RepID=A0A9N9X6C6_DIABA|nr:unnamed protein product [Diabrotica balteata]
MDEDNDHQPQPVPEVSTRSTRQRGGRTVCYKEDSDDEDLYKRKPRIAPVPKEVKEVHITGEESETSTSQRKKKEKVKKTEKTKKPVEEEEEEMSDEDWKRMMMIKIWNRMMMIKIWNRMMMIKIWNRTMMIKIWNITMTIKIKMKITNRVVIFENNCIVYELIT